MNLLKLKKSKFLLLIIAILASALIGCTSNTDIEESLIYTVIYDGNGGYLGNKTYTVRKLQVAQDSKIPKYLSYYSQDSYVVSSLGLAIRSGYSLQGWYLEENAEYAANPLGAYVYLDINDGNGLYQINAEGDYVYGYVEDTEGTLIYVNVEEIGEDVDPETVEYIYFNGGNGWGFYIYDLGNADHVEIYNASGSYTPAEVAAYGTYLVFSELTTDEQTLFADISKYRQDYYPYTEADEGLVRYSLDSGYIYFDTMMVMDELGHYVLDGDNYVDYDSENPAHADLDRYSIDSRYVFTSSASYTTPSDLPRYNADITYWDFENDRVTSDMVLIAHWEKKLTVQYIQMSGQITYITQKLTPDNTSSVDLIAGETIGKLETIPLYAGYTFVGWSTSLTEYVPWDFANDVFPIGQDTLVLYAFMVEGTYTRVNTAAKLFAIAQNPDLNYLLVADIDLEGQEFINISPLGFEVKASVVTTVVPFTGEFLSMGYKISNYTIRVQNSQKDINVDAGVIVVMGLFPYVQNATITGLTVENAHILFVTTTTGSNVICEIGGAGIIGTALDGESFVIDSSVEIDFAVTSPTQVTFPVYIGDIVALGSEYVTITGTTATIDYSLITGITTSTLSVQTLD
ncbi:MAG: InlB B-repeat-containing protein [Firmicutes bacterium]|nr:InlB B-repeat-containing protein [Bacillota bacterium]